MSKKIKGKIRERAIHILGLPPGELEPEWERALLAGWIRVVAAMQRRLPAGTLLKDYKNRQDAINHMALGVAAGACTCMARQNANSQNVSSDAIVTWNEQAGLYIHEFAEWLKNEQNNLTAEAAPERPATPTPQSFRAAAHEAGIELNWKPVRPLSEHADEDSPRYELWRWDANTDGWTRLKLNHSTFSTHLDTAHVNPHTTYWYAVRAVHNDEHSEWAMTQATQVPDQCNKLNTQPSTCPDDSEGTLVLQLSWPPKIKRAKETECNA